MALRKKPLLKATLRRVGPACSFQNQTIDIEICPGQLLWLQGPSGAGKTLCPSENTRYR